MFHEITSLGRSYRVPGYCTLVEVIRRNFGRFLGNFAPRSLPYEYLLLNFLGWVGTVVDEA